MSDAPDEHRAILLTNSNPLLKIPYVLVLQYAARKGYDSGLTAEVPKPIGFTL